MKIFRIDAFACFMVGSISLMAIIIGVGLYMEGQRSFGILCPILGVVFFIYAGFQKITFEGDQMVYRRPFTVAQRISLRNISKVSVFLSEPAGKIYWQCLIMEGEKQLLKFNPKLFSFSAIDYMFDQVRAYSPNAAIEDGTIASRLRSKKTPHRQE